MFARKSEAAGKKSLFHPPEPAVPGAPPAKPFPKIPGDDDFLLNLNDLLDEIRPASEHGPLSSHELPSAS